MDFAYDKLTYEEIYTGIDRKYWHNSILSIEDATLSYLLKFVDFPENIRETLRTDHINIDTVATWQYPFFALGNTTICTSQDHMHICAENKFEHIKHFFVALSGGCKEVWIYSYDPVTYLGIEVKSLFTAKT